MNRLTVNLCCRAVRSTHLILFYVVTGVVMVISGCGRDTTVASTSEAPSPDGQWIAITETAQNAGPGTGDIETTVYLKWARGTSPRTQILGFANNTTTIPSNTGVKVAWITDKHLDVTYERGNELGFQAVKAGGVEITAHELDK